MNSRLWHQEFIFSFSGLILFLYFNYLYVLSSMLYVLCKNSLDTRNYNVVVISMNYEFATGYLWFMSSHPQTPYTDLVGRVAYGVLLGTGSGLQNSSSRGLVSHLTGKLDCWPLIISRQPSSADPKLGCPGSVAIISFSDGRDPHGPWGSVKNKFKRNEPHGPRASVNQPKCELLNPARSYSEMRQPSLHNSPHNYHTLRTE
jgi:hypothetical protein